LPAVVCGGMRGAFVVVLGVCGCVAGRELVPPAPAAASECPRVEAPSGAEVGERELPAAPDPRWALTPDDVLLQLELVPTYGFTLVGNPLRPHGRVAEFTLYRDGTVIFVERGTDRIALVVGHVGEDGAADDIAHVRALGVDTLRDHHEHCLSMGRGRTCVSDSVFKILRARLADGTLRELQNYNGFAPEHMEMLHAIYDRITAIAASRSPAPLYLPHASTLFVIDADLSPLGKARAIPWPLDDELLAAGVASGVLALETEDTRAMIAATGTNLVRNVIFRLGDRYVYASVIPWLPHDDHRDAIARARATTE
jgi:hypothetical protein